MKNVKYKKIEVKGTNFEYSEILILFQTLEKLNL